MKTINSLLPSLKDDAYNSTTPTHVPPLGFIPTSSRPGPQTNVMDQVTSEPSLGSVVPAKGRKVLHLKGMVDLVNMDQQEAGDSL